MTDPILNNEIRAALRAAQELRDIDGLVGVIEDAVGKAERRKVDTKQLRRQEFSANLRALMPVVVLLSLMIIAIVSALAVGRGGAPPVASTKVVVRRVVITRTIRVARRGPVAKYVEHKSAANLTQPPGSNLTVAIGPPTDPLYGASQGVQEAVNWLMWQNHDSYDDVIAANVCAQQAERTTQSARNKYSLVDSEISYANDVDRFAAILAQVQGSQYSDGLTSEQRAQIEGAVSALIASANTV